VACFVEARGMESGGAAVLLWEEDARIEGASLVEC
jgi:hypothetical protein